MKLQRLNGTFIKLPVYISSNPITSNFYSSNKRFTCPILSNFFVCLLTIPLRPRLVLKYPQIFLVLVFVPPTFVKVAWRGLKGEAPAFNNRDQFFENFQGTSIEGTIHSTCGTCVCSLNGPHTAKGWHSNDSKGGR